jgi:hypothetical protein
MPERDDKSIYDYIPFISNEITFLYKQLNLGLAKKF